MMLILTSVLFFLDINSLAHALIMEESVPEGRQLFVAHIHFYTCQAPITEKVYDRRSYKLDEISQQGQLEVHLV